MCRRAWLCPTSLLGFSVCLALGCGEQKADRYHRESQTRNGVAPHEVGGADGAGEAAPAAKQAAPNAPPAGGDVAKAEPADRKIIYTAKLDLVVQNLDEAAAAIDEHLATHGGRLVRSESRSDSGARRSASYTLEVPAAKFRGLVAGLRKLGVPERDAVDSQDVSDEYQDILVRVRNMKAEEDNLLKLLAEKTRSVEEALAIRRQIQPIREAIERAEGRQKYIEAKAAYSTVTLTLREEANYVPPTADPPRTFAGKAERTFNESWAALVSFGEAVALIAVAASPWLPVVVPLGLVTLWGSRRLWSSRPAPLPIAAVARSSAETPTPPPPMMG
jgi:hypothetical protein